MAGRKGFENFEPIFGEAKADELEQQSMLCRRPFLFYVHALDPSRLEILASDFQSHTFARILTVHQLDDMRDDIGIGGSWSEFVDYLIASLSSGTGKLIMDAASNVPIDSGGVHAKLIAHKSKGLPRISLPLSKVTNSLANDNMANFSLALFKALKDKQNDSIKEHEQLLQMKRLLSSEKERSESLQKQLDGFLFVKRKAQKVKASNKTSFVPDSLTDSNTILVSETQPPSNVSETQPPTSVSEMQPPIANNTDNVEQPSVKDTEPTKVSQRVAPVSRRAKTRGVSLKDTGDDDN